MFKKLPPKIKIKVKRKHIKNGVRGYGRWCAVALAIKEQCRNSSIISVSVGPDTCMIQHIGAAHQYDYYEMSRRASRFIRKFDESKKSVKPFNFILTKVSSNF